jgi:quinol:cytochrome c oxidoreductase quinone-binding subunit 2
MYTLPSKLKLFAIIFMVIGAIGITSGFLSTPKTIEDVKEMMASNDDHNGSDEATQNGHEEAHDGDAHYEHVMHQMQNRPWSALYIASFFFFIIVLGVLAFYALQYAAQAGWSPVLFRVMEGITSYLPVASVIIIALLLASIFDLNHIFHWMDPDLVNPRK